MDKAYDDTSLRLVGGTYFNLILRSKKIKLDNGRVPSESEIFAGLLNVFGADVDIENFKLAEQRSFAEKVSNLKLCRKSSFSKSYLGYSRLEKIKQGEWGSAMTRMESFLSIYVEKKGISLIVSSLAELIKKDSTIADEQAFVYLDGRAPLSKRDIITQKRFPFVGFILGAGVFAFQQDNKCGEDTIDQWLRVKDKKSQFIARFGFKNITSFVDTLDPYMERQEHKKELEEDSKDRKFVYRITDDDFSALMKQAEDNPELYQFAMDIERNRNIYVQTNLFKETFNKVMDLNYVMLSGNPGSGKTLTSEMVALKIAGLGEYRLHYAKASESDLEKILSLITDKKEILRKEFILIDDCMGQASYDLSQKEENNLKKLVAFVKFKAPRKKLLLNSRIKVLNDAKQHDIYNSIFEEMINTERIIDTNKLTRREKALILRKHVFARTDNEHYLDLRGKRCLNIIDHNPYIPRVISHVTRKQKKFCKIEDGAFYSEIMNALNNPDSVWRKIYEDDRATPLICRLLLKSLYSLTNNTCRVEECKAVFEKYVQIEMKPDTTINLWEKALSALNESMVKRLKTNDGDFIGFIDPSVHDFLEKSIYYDHSSIEYKSLENGIIYSKQIVQIFGYGELSFEIKKQMVIDGRLAKLMYDAEYLKERDIFIHISTTCCCRDEYIPIVRKMLYLPNKMNYSRTYFMKTECEYAYPNFLFSLIKSEKIREYYLYGRINREVFYSCIAGINIKDACKILIQCLKNPKSFSFPIDENVLIKIMETAAANSLNEWQDEIDYISIDDNISLAEKNDLLQQRVLERCLEDVDYYSTDMPEDVYNSFNFIIEQTPIPDFSEEISGYCEDLLDEYDDGWHGEIEEQECDVGNSDEEIMALFSVPFPEK